MLHITFSQYDLQLYIKYRCEYNFMFDANVNPISLKLAISCLISISYLWKKYYYV